MTDTIRALYSSEAMQKAFAWIKEDESHTLEQQLELVQIPACFNCEEERALHFRRLMEAEGYKTHMDEVGNVYTRIRGTGNGPTVYISAHLDTVFPMDTPLPAADHPGDGPAPGRRHHHRRKRGRRGPGRSAGDEALLQGEP